MWPGEAPADMWEEEQGNNGIEKRPVKHRPAESKRKALRTVMHRPGGGGNLEAGWINKSSYNINLYDMNVGFKPIITYTE